MPPVRPEHLGPGILSTTDRETEAAGGRPQNAGPGVRPGTLVASSNFRALGADPGTIIPPATDWTGPGRALHGAGPELGNVIKTHPRWRRLRCLGPSSGGKRSQPPGTSFLLDPRPAHASDILGHRGVQGKFRTPEPSPGSPKAQGPPRNPCYPCQSPHTPPLSPGGTLVPRSLPSIPTTPATGSTPRPSAPTPPPQGMRARGGGGAAANGEAV